MSNDTETAARALVEATRSGKLGDAYRVLDKRPVDEVQAIALQAGFSPRVFHRGRAQVVRLFQRELDIERLGLAASGFLVLTKGPA